MNNSIKLVATDMDGTFLHSDNTYDVSRFKNILKKMKAATFLTIMMNSHLSLKTVLLSRIIQI